MIDPKFMGEFGSIPAHYQISVHRKGSFAHGQGGHLTITMTGDNARVNIGSTDSSSNTVNHGDLFADVIAAIEQGIPKELRPVLVESVHEMERTKDTTGFTAAYQKFVGLAAVHMTLVAPFLPALTALL